MKLRRFTDFPQDDDLYFCVRNNSFVMICEFDGVDWYQGPARLNNKINNDERSYWYYVEKDNPSIPQLRTQIKNDIKDMIDELEKMKV